MNTEKDEPRTPTSSVTAEPRTHRVVIFAVPDEPHALRDVLVDRLSLHPTDAQIHAHAVPGLLPDRLSQHAAAELASAIRDLGVNATAIPNDEIPDFGHSEMVHHARCTEEGLEIIELHGRTEVIIPWNELELMSIGHVPLETSQHSFTEATAVITAAPHVAHLPLELNAMSGPEAWLIRRDPTLGYRIDHNLMNYEYLGNRMTTSATRNFQFFADDIVERAPHLCLTPATRAFLQHGKLRHYSFASSEELKDYTIFHMLLLHQLQRQ